MIERNIYLYNIMKRRYGNKSGLNVPENGVEMSVYKYHLQAYLGNFTLKKM